MPALIKPAGPILVTGATGYIGTWIVSILLQRGLTVHAAVRTENKGQYLLNQFPANEKDRTLKLVIVGDISAPRAFDEAVKDVSGIIHTASPVGQPLGHPDEMINPAVQGVKSLLNSALKFNKTTLKRIVITSSCVAIAHSSPTTLTTVTEETWNNDPVQTCKDQGAEASGIQKYAASKVLSEKAVWEWNATHGEEKTWDISVLNPPWVFGPPIHQIADIKTDNSSFRLLHSAITKGEFASFDGDDPAKVPGHGWVDVRDIAEAHVRALVSVEEARGERTVFCEGGDSPFVWDDWVKTVKGKGKKMEGRESGVHFDTTKEKKILQMKFRSMEETGKDLLACFEKNGWD